MKTKLKIFKFIALLALFNSFYSCQEDEILIESDNKTFELKTSRVSINQVINEINTQKFKQKIQNKSFDSSISNSLLRTSDSDIYFIKKEKDDELISYILHLNSYSQSKPYFLKLIITQNNNETERMGYIKYIPTTPISILDMSTFSGEVQILDNNFEVNATSNYVNGVKQENLQNNGTQNRIICTDEIVITEVRCSHGGNHGVGQSCNNGLVNDAHYVISIFTRCTGDRTTPTQIIDDYGNPNSDGTSSVNVGMALAHNFSLNLTSEQKLIYDLNQSIAVYLADNVIVVPDPSYNPILGGNPTMPIIDPQAKQFALELINLANQNSEITNETITNTINEKSNDTSLNLQQAFTLAVINSSENPMTGANVELYLLLKYKNTSYFNSTSFAVVSNSINVGTYTLTPHYKSDNTLVYYAAVRYSGNNTLHDIEYIIKSSALSNFQENINLYTHAANLFYMNGTPTNGQIALCTGDYFSGLSQMWNDALHSPQWWAYAITCFGHAIVALPANTNVGSTVTSSQWKYSMKNLTNKAFQGKVVTNPQGVSVTINIPNNYVARIVDNGKGVKFVPQGTPLNSDANAIRIMEPITTGTYPHPKGYVKFYNNNGQPINPNNNQTLGNSNNHFDFQ